MFHIQLYVINTTFYESKLIVLLGPFIYRNNHIKISSFSKFTTNLPTPTQVSNDDWGLKFPKLSRVFSYKDFCCPPRGVEKDFDITLEDPENKKDDVRA